MKKRWKTYFQVQLWPKFGPPNFFLWVLPLLDVRHYCKLSLYAISRKTDEPNLRFSEKPNFRPDFGLLGPYLDQKFFSWILPLLDVRHYCKLSLHAISRKTDEPNLRFGEKPNFRPDFGLLGHIWTKNFFSWVLPLLHVRHSCKLLLYAIPRKTNSLNSRKWQKTIY